MDKKQKNEHQSNDDSTYSYSIQSRRKKIKMIWLNSMIQSDWISIVSCLALERQTDN